MSTAHPAGERGGLAVLPVPRLSFDEFLAFGRQALVRADVPVVIDLPRDVRGLDGDGVAERLGNMTVTLFTEPGDRQHLRRWTTREIRLREFFTDERYRNDPGTWHRVVSNLRDNPADIDALLGFDADAVFDYRRSRRPWNSRWPSRNRPGSCSPPAVVSWRCTWSTRPSCSTPPP